MLNAAEQCSAVCFDSEIHDRPFAQVGRALPEQMNGH